MQETQTGRLVVVLEKKLSAESRGVLKSLLRGLMLESEEVMFVAGLTRAAVVGAGESGGGAFYNGCEFIPLSDMLRLRPWRGVWMVNKGQVYGGGRG